MCVPELTAGHCSAADVSDWLSVRWALGRAVPYPCWWEHRSFPSFALPSSGPLPAVLACLGGVTLEASLSVGTY